MMTCLQVAFNTATRHSRISEQMLTSTMIDFPHKPFVLVPEIALLAPLSAHHRKRFETALYRMHDQLEDRLSWEQVAEQSAISPYHFHRQFTLLFNETPGQYLSRIRLQFAVSLLLLAERKTITEIAHSCGYSSSQSMAKAFKRELGMTAKNVRELGQSGTPKDTMLLLEKLAHPGGKQSLEHELAESVPCELVWYPERAMKSQNVPDFDWDILFETIGEKSKQFVCATPVMDLDNSWENISYTIGNWQPTVGSCDHFFSEGYYLCCEVYLVSDVAYISAIDGLFKQAEKLGYDVDKQGSLIEMVRDVELTLTGGATFAFQIPIV